MFEDVITADPATAEAFHRERLAQLTGAAEFEPGTSRVRAC